MRDKAHVFASIERVLIHEGISQVFEARPDLNFSLTEETRVWNSVVRFDHQIDADNTWGPSSSSRCSGRWPGWT